MMRTIRVLGHDDALLAIDTMREELTRRRKPGAMAVTDAHGEPIALLRLDGAALSWVTLAINKAYTAARLRRPSREVGERVREQGIDVAYYGDARYVGFGGGMPVVIDGEVVGGVAASGLSDEDDEALCVLAIEAIRRSGNA